MGWVPVLDGGGAGWRVWDSVDGGWLELGGVDGWGWMGAVRFARFAVACRFARFAVFAVPVRLTAFPQVGTQIGIDLLVRVLAHSK